MIDNRSEPNTLCHSCVVAEATISMIALALPSHLFPSKVDHDASLCTLWVPTSLCESVFPQGAIGGYLD